jgi:endoglucanase
MEALGVGRGVVAPIGTIRRRAGAFLFVALAMFVAACSDSVTGPLAPSEALEAKGGTKGKPKPGDPVSPPPEEPTAGTSANPIADLAFYVDPNSNARKQADEWRSSRPDDAAQMDKIAAQPQAKWLGTWLADPTNEVTKTMKAAAEQRSLAVFVAYNITNLDCGSSGASPDAYRTWISRIAAAIGDGRAVVILEPDALAAMGCLSAAGQQTRLELINYAIEAFRARPHIVVYVDAGHHAWQSAAIMADRLTRAGVARAHGFSLNVSNYTWTHRNVTYGNDLSSRIGGKRFVIDTSRNGMGPTADNEWCNAPGRALGPVTTSATDQALVDAYIWIKPPGESDGTCNGGPRAGAWWAEYALELALRAP